MAYSILDCFMIAAVCGFIYGVFYELLRLVRRIVRFNAVTFICDVIFFVAAGIIIVNLSMYLGNYIRLYTLLGFGAGVFAYIQTLGRLVCLIETAILAILRATVGAFLIAVYNYICRIIGAFAHTTASQFGKIHNFLVNKKKKTSTLLHFRRNKLYNNKREKIAIGESSRGKNVINVKIKRSS